MFHFAGLALSVCFADTLPPFGTCVPPPPAGGVFQRERLWQSAKSAVTARGSLFGRAGANVPERARMLTKSKTHSDTNPVCQRHCIATLSCFILLGLPSQALTRQLPQSGSPWQRGFVFDETDLRLLENVTECQSLSCQERWHRAKRRCRRGFVPTKTNPPHRASPVRGCGNGIRECLQSLLSQKTTMRVLPP